MIYAAKLNCQSFNNLCKNTIVNRKTQLHFVFSPLHQSFQRPILNTDQKSDRN
jgi:hypothetical protein